MIPRRVLVNLAAFVRAVRAAVHLGGAATSIHLDVIERPWRLAAEFEAAPGPAAQRRGDLPRRARRHDPLARPGGRTPSCVEMAIDRDQDLPEGLTAAIRRKSAVGEPYVALEPPKGYERRRPDARPRRAPHHPAALDDRPAQLRRPVRRPRRPRRRGAGRRSSARCSTSSPPPSTAAGPRCAASSSPATTCPARWPSARELFDQLAGDLTRLTHTLTAERDSIGRGLRQPRGRHRLARARAGPTSTSCSRRPRPRPPGRGPPAGDDRRPRLQLRQHRQPVRGHRRRGPDRQLLRVLDVAEEADVAFNTVGDRGR